MNRGRRRNEHGLDNLHRCWQVRPQKGTADCDRSSPAPLLLEGLFFQRELLPWGNAAAVIVPRA